MNGSNLDPFPANPKGNNETRFNIKSRILILPFSSIPKIAPGTPLK